ncbi:MAG: hypothetical protein FJ202_11630 [Gemmatimonadetes bacterium]|nr:hypothetical protein [Gemmatimonadota bacterium]
MFVFLRALHIVTGVFWAGTIFFTISFLMPAIKDVGPDGAKVFGALRARRMFNWVPAMALLSVLSGFWLYMIRMGDTTDWARSREAMMLGTGGITALLALVIGLVGMRANSLKADDISKAAGPMAAGPEKDQLMGQAMSHRKKAMMAGRAVATLLLITVITMAIARYTV